MGSPISIAPSHQITFPESRRIVSAVFSNDGSSLFVHIQPTTVNIWQVLVHEWAITLGVVAGIVVLVCAIWSIRVLRRRQQKGRSYCRKCNYCLDGVSNEGPCPECGRPIGAKGTVVGTATWRRLAVCVPVALVTIAGYATLHVTGMPRSVGTWFEWHSARLAQSWSSVARLSRYAQSRDRIVEVDPVSGEIRRVLATLSMSTRSPLFLTPDGRSLLVGDGLLVRVDARSGRVTGRVRLPGDNRAMGPSSSSTILGVVDGRAIACVSDSSDLKDRICAWDVASGELEILHESDMYVTANGRPSARSGVLVPGETLRVLSVPTFSENYEKDRAGQREYVVRDIDFDRSTVREIPLQPVPDVMSLPAVDPSSGLMFFTNSMTGIYGFEVKSGSFAGAVTAGMPISFWEGAPLVNTARRWIVASTPNDQLFVRDIDRREWIASLTYPEKLVRPEPYISNDGRRLAAIGFRGTGGGPPPGGYVHSLLLYDLSPLDAPADTPDSP